MNLVGFEGVPIEEEFEKLKEEKKEVDEKQKEIDEKNKKINEKQKELEVFLKIKTSVIYELEKKYKFEYITDFIENFDEFASLLSDYLENNTVETKKSLIEKSRILKESVQVWKNLRDK